MVNTNNIQKFLLRHPGEILKRAYKKEIIKSPEVKEFEPLFKYYRIQFSYNQYSPTTWGKDFVSVRIDSDKVNGEHSKQYQELLFKIQKDFKTLTSPGMSSSGRTGNTYDISILVSQVDEFMDKIGKDHPTKISASRREYEKIEWTNELITKYNQSWSWYHLHRTERVKWNYELIESNLEFLNWSFISSYPELNWTPELLFKYREYLIFSLDSHFPWSKSGFNKKGEEYSLVTSGETDYDWMKRNPYNNLGGSISSSKSIKWSKDIIKSVEEYWDWHELSFNNSVPWDLDLIEEFEEKIDFILLSNNTGVKWGIELLHEYKDKWSWEDLSGNPSLPWSSEFIEIFEHKWEWKDWDFFNEFDYWNEGIRIGQSHKKNIRIERNVPCISSNEGILWTVDLIDKYLDKIDLWIISRVGKIDDKAIVKYEKYLDYAKESGETIYYKHSDWREWFTVIEDGWENLSKNPYFKVTNKNVDFYFNINKDYKYPQPDFAMSKRYEIRYHSVLELFQNCSLKGFNLEELIIEDNKWIYCFYRKDFINDSLWTDYLIKHLSDNFVKDFLLLVTEKVHGELKVFLEQHNSLIIEFENECDKEEIKRKLNYDTYDQLLIKSKYDIFKKIIEILDKHDRKY